MRHAHPLMLILVLSTACAADHQTGRDAGRDAAGADARDPCTVGGIARCDRACGRNMSFCTQNDTRYEYCVAGLCLPTAAPSDPDIQHNATCSQLGDCVGSDVCVYDAAFGGGSCMPESFCDEAAREGYPLSCIWSGGTNGGFPRVRGAAHDVLICPATPYPSTPFCGSPCQDACSAFTASQFVLDPGREFLDNRGVCIGRSDTRGIGICGPDVTCTRGSRDGADWCTQSGLVDQVYPELAGTTCVCLVFRGASTTDGLSDYGWVSSREGCAAYRALYPGDIDCVVDRDWHRLP